jgi:hypothetical protein
MAASFAMETDPVAGVALVVAAVVAAEAAAAPPLAVEFALVVELSPGTSNAEKLTTAFCLAGCSVAVAVGEAGALGIAATVPALAVAALPVAVAELLEAAAVAAPEPLGGFSSAPADLHAIAIIIMAATNAPLLHTKQFEMNRFLIQPIPPSKLLRASRTDPVDPLNIYNIANLESEDLQDLN